MFTLAGDEIATLPSDNVPQEGGNIYWTTRNDDNKRAGIYIWG